MCGFYQGCQQLVIIYDVTSGAMMSRQGTNNVSIQHMKLHNYPIGWQHVSKEEFV